MGRAPRRGALGLLTYGKTSTRCFQSHPWFSFCGLPHHPCDTARYAVFFFVCLTATLDSSFISHVIGTFNLFFLAAMSCEPVGKKRIYPRSPFLEVYNNSSSYTSYVRVDRYRYFEYKSTTPHRSQPCSRTSPGKSDHIFFACTTEIHPGGSLETYCLETAVFA